MGAWLRRILALVAVLAALAGLRRVAEVEVLAPEPMRASDALPLYLSAGAVADGHDPTERASLEEAYDSRGMVVGAATFSTLYPPTAGSLLRGVASRPWSSFVLGWRMVLLLAVGGLGVAAGMLARRRGAEPSIAVAWGGATGAGLAWHPVVAEGVRLGQVNMLLAALCALAVAALPEADDRDEARSARVLRRAGEGTTGLLLALGALVKLVPGGLLIPLAASRRVRPVVVAACVGILGIVVAFGHTPPARFLTAVLDTLRFQSEIRPDWLVGRNPAPDWMVPFGHARHAGLQWITLLAAALVPAVWSGSAVTRAAMVLICAWLGADAAGFHVLYIPLAWPVLSLVSGRPAAWALGMAALWLAASREAPGPLALLEPEPRMVLAGYVLWGIAASELVAAARTAPVAAWTARLPVGPAFTRGCAAMAGVLCGVSLAASQPGNGPWAPPLPRGLEAPRGAGYIRAGDRAPGGGQQGLGAGVYRSASTLARPGTIRALQMYLRRAPLRWAELAERYPARGDEMLGRVSLTPRKELRDLSGRQVGTWLIAERDAIERYKQDGIDVAELEDMFLEAWASELGTLVLSTPTEAGAAEPSTPSGVTAAGVRVAPVVELGGGR
jgi:hypothetical protein